MKTTTQKQALADAAEKLRKLAGKKMTRALRTIRTVGFLGRYNPSATQIDAIAGALHAEVDKVIAVLQTGKGQSIEFDLFASPRKRTPQPKVRHAGESAFS